MAPSPARPLARLEVCCREADTSDALVERVGTYLADAVDADAHVFLRLDPLTALWTGAHDRGHAPAACEEFTREVFLRSPWADYGQLAMQSPRVHELARGAVPADPYTAVYLDGYGFRHELHVSFAEQGMAYGALTLSRRHGDFDPAARRLVASAVGPVTQHLRRLLAKETLETAPGTELGLLLVDQEGKLSGGNAVGESLLQAHRQQGGIASRSVLAVMAELARRSLVQRSTEPLPRVVYVQPQTQRRYRLLAEPLQVGASPGVVVIVAEPLRALDSVELLRRAGLTPREAEVAIVTLRGFRSAEGARTLQLAESTFLGHLKSVYKKLGVGSRAELASLLLGGL